VERWVVLAASASVAGAVVVGDLSPSLCARVRETREIIVPASVILRPSICDCSGLPSRVRGDRRSKGSLGRAGLARRRMVFRYPSARRRQGGGRHPRWTD